MDYSRGLLIPIFWGYIWYVQGEQNASLVYISLSAKTLLQTPVKLWVETDVKYDKKKLDEYMFLYT